MNSRPSRLRSLVGFILIVAIALACWLWLIPALVARQAASSQKGKPGGSSRRGSSGGPNAPAQTVSAITITPQDFPVWAIASGTATPLQLVTIRSQVTGVLKAIHFQEGQMVEKNQLLAEIDPEPFLVAVQTAIGQQNRDRALLENAQKDLLRYQALLAQDSIAKQQVDTQISLVKQLKATIAADQSSVDAAQLQLNFTKIHAPLAGRIGLRQVDVGNLIRSADTAGLATLAQVNPISMVFSLPQEQLTDELRAFSSGKPHPEIPVEALANDQKTIIARGKLLTTDNQIDLTSGTLKMRALFDNQNATFFPNQFATIRIRLANFPNALSVPNAAIQQTTQGTGIFLADSQNHAKFQLVEIGTAQGESTLITKGIQAGDRIITEGFERIKDGSPVSIASDHSKQENSPNSPAPKTREKSTSSRQHQPS